MEANNSSLDLPSNADSKPRLKLKRAARRLIAERGVRDVSVREIAQAAQQKNMGAVAYYFGTKDKLISEILIDGAKRIEKRRQSYLDAMEVEGGPERLDEAVAAIVLPSAEFSEHNREYGEYFNRFLMQLSLSNTELIDRTLEGRWNKGYQRCLRHLRHLMSDQTRVSQNRRFVFLGSYISILLAQREMMIADNNHAHPTWRSNATLRDIIQTAAALLEAPPG
jgi:AcrR family transcriptional regulator